MDGFAAADVKLARASRHVAELSSRVKDHIATVPMNFIVKDLPGGWTAQINIPDPPDEFSAILGDIVHNARSSLDLMAGELARRHLGTELADRNVYFPFAESRDRLDEQIKKKNFHRCGPEAVELLKALAPFKGGNAHLRAIHDLDIIDKHRSLIPIPAALRSIELYYESGEQTQANRHEYHYGYPKGSAFAGIEIVEGSELVVKTCKSVLEAFVALQP